MPKPIDKKGNLAKLDVRHPTDIACLIIDTSVVPQEERDAYFLEKTEEITKAFYTLDKETDMPYPEAIKPYIKMVYDKMIVDQNINWDSVDEVEKLLATIQASQSFVTLVQDFPDLISELYPTIEDVSRLDALVAKSTMICHDAKMIKAGIQDPDVAPDRQEIELQIYDTVENKVISEVTHPLFDARINGSDTIYLDALASDFTKKYFLDVPFTKEIREYEYNSDGYAKIYLDYLAIAYKNASVEQLCDKAIAEATQEDNFEFGRLFINGKSIKDSIREIQEEQNCALFDAKIMAGKMLRDALTDGESIVTMMQVVTGAGGKSEFRHQEIKVDLDKLNKVDKAEGNYSIFRKILDFFHISKIQRFKSNDERNAAQAKLREDGKIQNALREAEDKYINLYNSDIVQNKLAISNPAFAKAFPKIERAEEFEKENQVYEAPERISISNIVLEPNNTVKIEPKHDELDKTLSSEQMKI